MNKGGTAGADSAGPSFLGTFALVFLAMAALFAIDTFLAKMERSEKRAEAQRIFAEAQRLAAEERTTEAIERFRSGLSIARDDQDYELALARALVTAGRLADAQAVVNEALQRAPTSGAANLTMARIFAQQGNTADAFSYYHRAIYGRWKDSAADQRLQVRLELVDFLARQGDKGELLAELLRLQDEVAGDRAVRERIGHLFVAAGSPARAAGIFRELLRQQPQDAGAYAGLGEAEFAEGRYRAAQTHFQVALRLRPDDTKTQNRLELCGEVLALDPTLRGLSAGERYRRSLRLVSRALESVSQCLGSVSPPSVRELADNAQRTLGGRIRASQMDNATEANLELAEQLWQAGRKECKQVVTDAEEPLALVLAKVSQ
ncbi:MAG: tetratricopeptide repeat protein [Bryobacteraceae bacterium]